MRYLSVVFLLVIGLMVGCQTVENPTLETTLVVKISDAYSTGANSGEASVLFQNFSPEAISEMGVVWGTKSRPTVADSRQSLTKVRQSKGYFFTLPDLVQTRTYYVRAYYVQNGELQYSDDEVVFRHSFSIGWIPVQSPILDEGRYVSADGLTFSGSGGAYVFYAVDKQRNLGKELIFYPGFDDWSSRFQRDFRPTDQPMRYEPFVAELELPNVKATVTGGGYYLNSRGEKFFLRDYTIRGIAGYKWEPQYPGAEAPTTSFSIGVFAYIMEQLPNGKLWQFDAQSIRWKAVNTTPTSQQGRYVSIDAGERAYVMFEPANRALSPALYEYEAATNRWIKMPEFPGENRRMGVAFHYNGNCYFGIGESVANTKGLRDIWRFDTQNRTWKLINYYPGRGNANLIAATMNDNLYIGFGQHILKGGAPEDVNDFWRFYPE